MIIKTLDDNASWRIVELLFHLNISLQTIIYIYTRWTMLRLNYLLWNDTTRLSTHFLINRRFPSLIKNSIVLIFNNIAPIIIYWLTGHSWIKFDFLTKKISHPISTINFRNENKYFVNLSFLYELIFFEAISLRFIMKTNINKSRKFPCIFRYLFCLILVSCLNIHQKNNVFS